MPLPHWTDEPVTSHTQDELGRVEYARQVAELLDSSHTFDASVVFGLTGPWGSGKTSIIELVDERLKSAYPKWLIARFTPWAASDVDSLLSEFYSALISALPKSRQRQARKALGAVAAVAAPALSAIPIAGSSMSEIMKMAGQRLTSAQNYATAFAEASRSLKEIGRPILLIADDIDRLQLDELLALLKVVRLVGRFPGVSYLMAYDEKTVFSALDAGAPAGSFGRDFMEKIVQYPLTVPAFSETQLFARLEKGLESALAESGRRNFPEGGLSHARNVLRGQLRTPRAVDRYVAQVRNLLNLVPEAEINDGDLMLVTLLRVAFPSVFRELPRWRRELLSGGTGELDFSKRPGFSEIPFEPSALLRDLQEPDDKQALELLEMLFPKIKHTGYSVSSTGARRMSQEQYFDRYLAMGVPTYDIEDSSVALALETLRQKSTAEIDVLLNEEDHKRSALIVDKLQALTVQDNSWTDADRLLLLEVLARHIGTISDERGLFLSTRDHVRLWMGDLISRMTDVQLGEEGIYAALKPASLVARLGAFDRSSSSYRDKGVTPPQWWESLGKLMAQDCADAFLSHLAEGDRAPQAPTLYWADFCARRGDLEGFRRDIGELVAAKGMGWGDLAARLVSTRINLAPGAKTEIAELDAELWEQLSLGGDDDWIGQPTSPVDTSDVSWANRRLFARGRVGRLAESGAASPSGIES